MIILIGKFHFSDLYCICDDSVWAITEKNLSPANGNPCVGPLGVSSGKTLSTELARYAVTQGVSATLVTSEYISINLHLTLSNWLLKLSSCNIYN